jgi:UrcA family protein
MSSIKPQFPHRVGAAVAAVAAIAAVAVSALAIGAGVSGAAGAAQPRTLRVAYTAFDLSQPMGAQLLYHRLQQAASNVCGSLDRADIGAYLRWQHCYDGTLQRAVLQIDAPQLLAVYHIDTARARSAG